MSSTGPVLVDTDAFGRLFIRRRPEREDDDADLEAWKQLLRGRRVVISFQTRTELLQGALAANWGETRYGGLRGIVDRTPTIGVDNEVIDSHALLYADCRRVGHPLQAKLHTADRWVAACAIAKQIPVLAGDGIYRDVPRLDVVN